VSVPKALPSLLDRYRFREVYGRGFRGGRGTTAHWHPDRDELILLLRGRAYCEVFRTTKPQVELVKLDPGQWAVLLPRGVGHRLVSVTDSLVLVLATRRGTKRSWSSRAAAEACK
jgi:oxalate decarboxylase/phosphoglucose isomerase-like protein (cupin superfamily)